MSYLDQSNVPLTPSNPFSDRRLQQGLVDHFERQFEDYIRHLNQGPIPFDLNQDAFFFTFEWNTWEARRLKFLTPWSETGEVYSIQGGDSRYEFNEVDYFFCNINRELFGHQCEKRSFWPTLPHCLVGFDCEGTRGHGELEAINNIHLAGLGFYPPSVRGEVRPAVERVFQKQGGAKGNVVAQLIRFDEWIPEHSIGRAIAYHMKGALKVDRDGRFNTELLRSYPNPNGLTYNYPAPKKGSIDRAIFSESDAPNRKSWRNTNQRIQTYERRLADGPQCYASPELVFERMKARSKSGA